MGVGALLSALLVLPVPHDRHRGAAFALVLTGALMTAGTILCAAARRHEMTTAAQG